MKSNVFVFSLYYCYEYPVYSSLFVYIVNDNLMNNHYWFIINGIITWFWWLFWLQNHSLSLADFGNPFWLCSRNIDWLMLVKQLNNLVTESQHRGVLRLPDWHSRRICHPLSQGCQSLWNDGDGGWPWGMWDGKSTFELRIGAGVLALLQWDPVSAGERAGL